MHSVLGAAIMLVIAVGAYGAGAVAQAVGARQAEAHPDGSRGLFAILSHPASLLGLVFDLVAWVLSRLALHTLPLFTVNTVLAGSLAVTVLLSHRFLETALHRRELWAIGATVLGLVLVGLAADSSVASRDTSATAMRDSAVVIVTRPATPAKGRVVAAPEPPYRIEADRKANGNARVMKHLNAHPERQAARKAYRRTQMARVMLPGVRRLKTTIGSLLSMHSEIAVVSITRRRRSRTCRCVMVSYLVAVGSSIGSAV